MSSYMYGGVVSDRVSCESISLWMFMDGNMFRNTVSLVSVTVFVRTLNGFIVAFDPLEAKVTLRLFILPLNLLLPFTKR